MKFLIIGGQFLTIPCQLHIYDMHGNWIKNFNATRVLYREGGEGAGGAIGAEEGSRNTRGHHPEHNKE